MPKRTRFADSGPLPVVTAQPIVEETFDGAMAVSEEVFDGTFMETPLDEPATMLSSGVGPSIQLETS
jgi:hypothetical protein